MPRGSVGFRWGEKGKWNLEEKESSGRDAKLRLTLAGGELLDVGFPYFGNIEHDHFTGTDHPSVLTRKVPARRMRLKDGEALVATVFDLFLANYGVDRGFGGEHVPRSYDDAGALFAGLGRGDHRRQARPDRHRGARVRPQRREDQGPVDGHHRRRP